MDRENQIIIDMDRIIECIDAFRWSGVSDEIIVKRIYHLCRFERSEAQKRIDAKLDAMEKMFQEQNA